MKYNPNHHHRKSMRLQGYDYSQEGIYFVTLCVKNRECLFGEIKDGEMILNDFGKIAAEEWINTEKIRDNIRIHEYVVMPNHIHGIIEIVYKKKNESDIKEKEEEGNNNFKSPSQTIGAIVRGYKIATIKKIKRMGDCTGECRGELQFALTNTTTPHHTDDRKGESQFAPTHAPTIWQRNYYDIIIRDQKSYEKIATYIINNPQNWNNDNLNTKQS